ncbi:MAG: hypothetical protein R6V14_03175 [Halanaerobiales bacterium]
MIKFNLAQAIESSQPEKYEVPVMKKVEIIRLLNILKEDFLCMSLLKLL